MSRTSHSHDVMFVAERFFQSQIEAAERIVT